MHKLKSITASAFRFPKIDLGAMSRGIKQFIKFVIQPSTADKRRWYQISPRKFAVVAMIIIIPEFILQVTAFAVWLLPRYDHSPSVLCIADYETSYPSKLQEQLKKEHSEWKVIEEVNPDITINSAQKIIDSYRNTRKPSIVYLSVGRTSVHPPQSGRPLIWDDSFEWKWRTIHLGNYFSTGDFYSVVGSDHFRESSQGKAKNKASLFLLEELSHSVAAEENKIAKPNLETSPLDTGHLQPEVYDNLKFKELLSTPEENPVTDFPLGAWGNGCMQFDFRSDHKFLAGKQSMDWSVDGSHLKIETGERQINFLWRMQGDRLILFSELTPIVFSMRKASPGAPGDLRLLFATSRLWLKMSKEDFNEKDESVRRAIESCPQDQAVLAFQARIFSLSGQKENAQKNITTIKNEYQKHPDQATAESLLFSMAQESDVQKAQTAIQLLNQYPFSISLWANLAEYSAHAGNIPASKEFANRAVKLIPDYLKMAKPMLFKNLRSHSGMGFTEMMSLEAGERNVLTIQDPEKRKRFEQLKSAILTGLFNLVKQFPDKNPQIVFVPYLKLQVVNAAMVEIARKEKTPIIDVRKILNAESPASKAMQKSGFQAMTNHETEEESNLLAKMVLEDLTARTKNRQNP